MLTVFCPCCGAELNSTGAVLAIPKQNKKVDRHMLCVECHPKFLELIGDAKWEYPAFARVAVYISPPTNDGGDSEMWFIPGEIAENLFKYNLICTPSDDSK